MKGRTIIFCFMVLCLSAGMVFGGGGGSQTPSAAGGQRVTTNVTPRPLTVSHQFGEARFAPQPATSYTTNPRYPQQPAYSNPNGFPIVQDRMTIRVATPYTTWVLDYEDNDQTRWIEELTNMRIEWDLLQNSNERLSLMFAAGDGLPDVFMDCPLPTSMLITIGQGGLVIPLQDMVNPDIMYNYLLMVDDFPTAWAASHSADGNVYGLALATTPMLTNQQGMRLWINRPFMERLGLRMPTTTEEYYQYLVAVRDRDPNGNGQRDEIPLIGGTNGWIGRIDGFLMNAFIINDATNDGNAINRWRLFLQPDGRVDASYIKPEWRQGLEYMRRLNAEGLLASESFTIVQDELRAIVEAPGPQRVGSVPNGGNHNFANPTGQARNEFTTIPPLRGPNGVQISWYDQYSNITVGRFAISRDCLFPEIAMKWADAQMTPDFHSRSRYGVLGRDWIIPPAGTPGVDGGPALYEEILVRGAPQNALWNAGLGRQAISSYNRAFAGDVFELEYVLWQAFLQYDPYKYPGLVPRQLPFTLDESRTFTDLNNQVVQYVEQFIAQTVTGRIAINDNTWDTYLRDLERLGLPRLLETVQAGFDRGWARTLGYNR